MSKKPPPELGRAANEVGSILQEKFQAKGETLDEIISSSAKRLPRSVQRSAAVIAQIDKQARYQPFLLEAQKKSVEKARKHVADTSDQEEIKAKRKIGRRQWISGLVLNYAAFLLLLSGFWYVGTNM